MTAPTMIQNLGQATASETYTATSNFTVGSTIILVLAEYDGVGQTITDVKIGTTDVTFSVPVYPQDAGAGSPQGCAAIIIPNNPVSGQKTITFTYTGGNVIATWACEVGNLGSAPVIDAQNSGHGASNTIASGVSSPASTTPDAFVIAAAASYNGTSAAPSETWTNTDLGIGGHLSVAWEIQSSSGQTYSFTQGTGGGIGWAAWVLVIRAASASGPPVLLMAAGLV
jgi:hypothetical protein